MKVIHGDLKGSRKIGFKRGLYGIWIDIKKRCENKKHNSYKNYGSQGIRCEFTSYIEFKKFIKENLGNKPDENCTLDRIDSKGNYSVGNLRWATQSEQKLNRGLWKNKTSKYRGVNLHKKTNSWKAQITIDSKKIFLGTFKNETDAAEAYLEKYYNHYKQWPPEYKPMTLNFRSNS